MKYFIYTSHSKQCLTTFSNTSKLVKNTPPSVVFSTLFSVFGNVVKHSLSCLIYYLNDLHYLRLYFYQIEPVKPVIEVPEPGREIPFGDGSLVTMNIGDNVTAASNTTITIRCPVSGVPTPVVTWNKDDVPVVDGGRINFAENNTLVIKQVELDDSAKYTCSVQNTFGQDEASSIVRIIGLCVKHLLEAFVVCRQAESRGRVVSATIVLLFCIDFFQSMLKVFLKIF